ncbi:peptide ABC transporter permease [Agrobacterium tumefaciens]|uniref:Peptide ABC transporter permease n=1 Tax=Agrobacterium tumefaciens TaxID=358 RepID=A0A0D0JY67_AGRTU|nr:ABC transporter permease [Rhizobium skierniewicense]KIQ00643.1 peptide ABC transporter permease [Agrobacterium tumefaciens]MCI9866911.1 ABC transporter permease [Rhizobium skierniewicense]
MTDTPLAQSEPHSIGAEPGRLSMFMRDFLSNPVAAVGAAVFLTIVFLAIAAPLVSPQNPYDLMTINFFDSRLPPGTVSPDGMTYLLGTDEQGRDMLSAIIYGLRISLLVGVGSAIIAGIIGSTIGLIAAYAGGRVDAFLMRLVDLQLSFPSILIALMLLSVLGKGIFNVTLALVLVEWTIYARVARSAALVEKKKEYMEAAACLGIPKWRQVMQHLLPNCMPPLIVICTIQIAGAIGLEATLSFLGLGVPLTEPSLGLLISNGYSFMLSGAYWISFFPGIALLVTIVSINLVGDHLRDVLNPQNQK